jgi:hypothetical protein
MKKLIFVSLMAMLVGSAWAKWVVYAESEETTFYFDPATIRKEGNMRRVWVLQDLRKPDKVGGEMSVRARNEYDCKNERIRTLGLSTHSEPMARGTVLELGGEKQNWREIAPETVNETIFNIVCAK